MSNARRNSHSLKADPIPVLVRRISIPVITGMFFQTMYNVVDTWAAGKLSTTALGALSASFPVFFLIIATAHGCQAAANALMSHALGADQHQDAEELGGQALFFALWMSLAVAVLGWWSCPALLDFMGLEPAARDLAASYLRTLFLGTPFFVVSATLNGILSSHGDTRPFRNAIIAGFLLNIVFDLWFVFGGFGLAPMGFPGIARATVLLQGLGMTYVAVAALRGGALTLSGLSHMRPRLRVQLRLMGQGFPALMNMLTIATGIFVYTYFAAKLGTPVVAAMGVSMRIEQIVLLPAVGLNTAVMTLAGHSLGSGNLDRLRDTVITCLKYGGLLYLAGGPLAAAFAPFWVSRFTDNPEVIRMAATLLRITMLGYYAYVILFVLTSALQGLQRPFSVLVIGLARQILAPLLLVPFLMARLEPAELGIWWGAFASVWSGSALAVAYALYTYRKLKMSRVEA